jgi:hypothetical protein
MDEFPRCAGCGRELEIGDQYIEGTASDYLGHEGDPGIGGLLADIVGGSRELDGRSGGKIIYCEPCTVPGGDFRFSTYYGDEREVERDG